jgi:BON domain
VPSLTLVDQRVFSQAKDIDLDDDFVEMLYQALASTGLNALRSVRIELRKNQVVLHGVVSSYYLKQMAQEAIRPILFGLSVKNRLQVVYP